MTDAPAPRKHRPAPSRTPPRSARRNVGVALACKRCGARLVPITGPWGKDRDKGTRAFKCPRLTACGYGGLVEKGAATARVPTSRN